jgi:hypothetical protein
MLSLRDVEEGFAPESPPLGARTRKVHYVDENLCPGSVTPTIGFFDPKNINNDMPPGPPVVTSPGLEQNGTG